MEDKSSLTAEQWQTVGCEDCEREKPIWIQGEVIGHEWHGNNLVWCKRVLAHAARATAALEETIDTLRKLLEDEKRISDTVHQANILVVQRQAEQERDGLRESLAQKEGALLACRMTLERAEQEPDCF